MNSGPGSIKSPTPGSREPHWIQTPISEPRSTAPTTFVTLGRPTGVKKHVGVAVHEAVAEAVGVCVAVLVAVSDADAPSEWVDVLEYVGDTEREGVLVRVELGVRVRVFVADDEHERCGARVCPGIALTH